MRLRSLTVLAMFISQIGLAAQPTIRISIPQTGSTPSGATLKFTGEPEPVALSCTGGFQAENIYSIWCEPQGTSPRVKLFIFNVFGLGENGTLSVEGQAQKELTCRLIHDEEPNGPVECSGD